MVDSDIKQPRYRSFGAVHRYYQGPNAISLLGGICLKIGNNPVLICDDIVKKFLYKKAKQSCESRGLNLSILLSSKEVTHPNVNALIEQSQKLPNKVDIIIAAGGGKGVDTGKAVAHKLGLPLVVIPTAASNDGPCSRAYVYYSEEHELLSVEKNDSNPEAVIVDTEILVKAPRSLLLSGIGDALCKLYEGEQVSIVGGTNMFGGTNTIAASYLRQACNDIIRQDTEDALLAVENKTVTPAFERLTEALVLLSGLAFENSGLSIAHSITRGLTKVTGASNSLHGQHVAYGLMVQWLLEQRSTSFINQQFSFYKRIGLACKLVDLGISVLDKNTIKEIAVGTLTSPHIGNFKFNVTEDSLTNAMQFLETRDNYEY